MVKNLEDCIVKDLLNVRVAELHLRTAEGYYKEQDYTKFFNSMTRYFYHKGRISLGKYRDSVRLPSGELLISYNRMRYEEL